MPKFLDTPQWYNSSGALVTGLNSGATVKWEAIASTYTFSGGYSSYKSPSGTQLVMITDSYRPENIRTTH